MNLKYKEFQSILSSANTSYKFLLFYSLINILKKDPKISEITYKELLKNILKLAWFPCFQFSLKFRDQDRIKSVLDKLTKSVNLDLKIKQPNNKIIKKIEEEIDALLSVEENYEMVDSLLLKYVLDRLMYLSQEKIVFQRKKLKFLEIKMNLSEINLFILIWRKKKKLF